ncbi:MAG: hypothetical protein ACLP2Y_00985 [Limisphaerales bacterium]
MKLALDPKIEKRIRLAVKPSKPYALDELMEEICGDDAILRGECSEIVTNEYRAVFPPCRAKKCVRYTAVLTKREPTPTRIGCSVK